MVSMAGLPHIAVVISISSPRILRTSITPASPPTARPPEDGAAYKALPYT